MLTSWNQNNDQALSNDSLVKSLKYVDSHWNKLTCTNSKDTNTLVGLPNPYIIPSTGKNTKFKFDEQYYWDTFFIILGLTDKKYKKLAKGMIDNLVYLYEKFGIIPNASRVYSTGRSQPPLLTSMANLYKDRFGCSDAWFDKVMATAENEYNNVWMGQKHPHWRRIGKLNRYYDINGVHDLAEAESGWDMTTRFGRKCLDYYPIDLNSLLYKYEKDFAQHYADKGQSSVAGAWCRKANARAEKVDELLWSPRLKFYFDYNHEDEKRGPIWSLAAFYPMWAKMITHERAADLVKQLGKFEKSGGLTATTKPMVDLSIFGSVDTQWAYPNGWAPLHWIVIKGLDNYGYTKEAKKIARKWINTNLSWYEQHGQFSEKYNVANKGKMPVEGVYPNQSGFGWTNGVFVDLVKDYI